MAPDAAAPAWSVTAAGCCAAVEAMLAARKADAQATPTPARRADLMVMNSSPQGAVVIGST
jgi:hypothetical protein